MTLANSQTSLRSVRLCSILNAQFFAANAAEVSLICLKFSIARFLMQALKTFMLRSGQVEAIKVHHLGPGSHEVLDKLLLRVRACVDLG